MRKNKILQNHARYVVMIIPILIMIVLSVAVTIVVSGKARRGSAERLRAICDSRAEMTDQCAADAEGILDIFSGTPEVIAVLKNPNDEKCLADARKCIDVFSQKLKNAEGIYISQWDSRILAHTDASAEGKVFRESYGLKSLRENLLKYSQKSFYSTGSLISPVSGEPVVAMYKAVLDDDGQPAGFVGMGFYTSEFLRINQIPEEWGYESIGFCMADVSDGSLIFSSDSSRSFDYTADLCEKFRNGSAEGNSGKISFVMPSDKARYISVYRYLPERNWLLCFDIPEKEAFTLASDMQMYLTVFFILVAVILTAAVVEMRRTSKKISSERAANEKKYHDEMERLVCMLSANSSMMNVNLAGNEMISVHGLCSEKIRSMISESSDGAVEICREFVLGKVNDSGQREEIIKIFNSDYLNEKFNSGETELKYRYSADADDGSIEKRELSVRMLRNLVTGDLEAVFRTEDVSDEYYRNLVGSHLATRQFKFTAVVFLKSGIVRSLANNTELGNENKFIPYNFFRKDIYEKLIDRNERDEFNRKVSLDAVREGLEESDVYTVYVHGISEYREKRYLKYEFQYIDNERETVLMCVADETPVWETDTLTGLCNYKGFISLAGYVLESDWDDTEYSVIVTNIKWFKVINRIFGSAVCDKFLVEYAEMLRNSDVEPLVIGRFPASDHFIMLVRRDRITDEALKKISRQHIETDEREADVLVTSGIYNISSKKAPVSAMVEHAIMAFKSIKDVYSMPYSTFSEEEEERYLSGKLVVSGFDKALRDEEFQPYYQPIYDSVTHKIVSAEALVRWNQNGNLIPPGMFIPALEENGSVSRVDRYISERVTALLRRRKAEGKLVVPVSINLSAMDFYASETIDSVMNDIDTMCESGIKPRYEITETAWADAADNRSEIIESMRAKGAQILIDDFGSGYSSFSTVRDYNFDILKIDMGFVRKLGTDSKVDGIVNSIIEMAHSIGLKVVAEGVEYESHLNFLREHGCDYIQGYYFSKPLPEAEFEKLLDMQENEQK